MPFTRKKQHNNNNLLFIEILFQRKKRSPIEAPLAISGPANRDEGGFGSMSIREWAEKTLNEARQILNYFN